MDGKYHFSPFPFFQVKKIIDSVKPDIVNICSPYPISWATLTYAKKREIPVVGSIHILPENILAPFRRLNLYSTIYNYVWSYLIYFYNLVDWATIPTQTGADMYTSRGLKTNITPISNGVDTVLFNPNNNGEYLREKFGVPRRDVVLYTGRINDEKNLDVLVQAIPYVLDEVDAHFLFCGSGGGYKKKMIQLVEQLKVSDYTTFIDFLDWKDYPNVYSLADVFVMPAEAELQSIVTLEAVASGLPVVAVNKGAVPELVVSGNGFLFESGNSEQLADHVISILSNHDLKRTMSQRSLEAIKRHSMGTVCSQYLRVYENLLSRHQP
jgi:glycosyltransferase involved in cell wall biosynthesis